MPRTARIALSMIGVSASSRCACSAWCGDDRGLDHRGEAHLGVAAAGLEGRPAGGRQRRLGRARRDGAMLLRQQQPRRVHVGAGDMGVDVDRARHDDLARRRRGFRPRVPSGGASTMRPSRIHTSPTSSRPCAGSMTRPPAIRVSTARAGSARRAMRAMTSATEGRSLALRGARGDQRAGRRRRTRPHRDRGRACRPESERCAGAARLRRVSAIVGTLRSSSARRCAIGRDPQRAIGLAAHRPAAARRSARDRARDSRGRSRCAAETRSSSRTPADTPNALSPAASGRPVKRVAALRSLIRPNSISMVSSSSAAADQTATPKRAACSAAASIGDRASRSLRPWSSGNARAQQRRAASAIPQHCGR